MSTAARIEDGVKRPTVQSVLGPVGFYLTQPVRLLRNYDRANLRPDLIAGATVAIILLPQAIAFAQIANLPPQMGLYAAIIGGIIGALWGSSAQLYTGPTNTLSLLVLSTLADVAVVGSPEYIVAAGLLAVMVGLFQLLLGLARLGLLVNFVSHSVIVGFSTGAGVLIAVSQLQPLLGLDLDTSGVLNSLVGTVTNLDQINPATAAIGIGTIVFLVVVRRINERIPAAIVSMIIASVVVYAFDLTSQGVEVVGMLPRGLPPFTRVPIFDVDMISSLAAGALAVGAIGLVQTAAISKSVSAQTRQRLDSNQEFVGQGLANTVAGFFSGYPVSGSFSVTAVNFRAGAQTPVAAVLAGIFVLIAIQFMGPFAANLPRAALAGALIVTAYRMIDTPEIMRILRGGRGDAVIMVVTFLGTLFLHLETAVFIGILLSFARYILRTSTPSVYSVVPDESFRHVVYDPSRPECPQLALIEILGDLYFGAVNHVEDFILDHSAQHPEQIYLLLRMHHVNNCDFSGIYMLENVVRYYRERGGDVYMVRVNPAVMQRMDDTGFDDYLGQDHFLDDDDAISYLFYHVLQPTVCIYECPLRVFEECQNLPKRLDLTDYDPGPGVVAENINWIDARTLWNRLHPQPRTDAPVIIDVREPREYRQGHIVEAISLPLTTIPESGPGLPKDKPIVLVCRTSRRSRLAAGAMQKLGYEDLTILDGGMLGWEAAGLLEAVDAFPTNGGSL